MPVLIIQIKKMTIIIDGALHNRDHLCSEKVLENIAAKILSWGLLDLFFSKSSNYKSRMLFFVRLQDLVYLLGSASGHPRMAV